MTNNLRNIFLFITVSLFFSCETVVVLDMEEDPTLVVNSLFTPGDVTSPTNPFEVSISETSHITANNDLKSITTAEVTIKTSDEEEQILSLDDLERPIYRTRTNGPKEGSSYELHVSNEGHESVIAKSYVPHGVAVENLTFSNIESQPHEAFDGETSYTFNVQFEIQDDIEEENFYHLILYRVAEYDLHGDFPSEIHTTINFDKLKMKHDPSIIVENYNRSFFGAHIKDELFNGQRKKFDLEMIFSKSEKPWPENIKIEAELKTVSKDYYKYSTEIIRYVNNGSSGLFNDQIVVSNNIENGYGVFAGYSVRTNRKILEE